MKDFALGLEHSSVTVLLVTYNHSAYIEKALYGLFAQVLPSLITVVVADDGSTDDTVSRIRSASRQQSSKKFKFLFLDSNFNHGITRNYERAFSVCTTDFIAVLEGDDYWISPHKLQAQLTTLNTRLECDVCSANYYVFHEHQSQFDLRTPIINQKLTLISARDLIADNIVGNFSTCMYRRSALMQLSPRIYEHRSYDWIINISLARACFIAFLNEPLSVYRLHKRGVWSSASHTAKLKDQLGLIPLYDVLTDKVFSEEFEELSSKLRQQIAVFEAIVHVTEESGFIQKSVPLLVKIALSTSMNGVRNNCPQWLKKFLKKLLIKNEL